MNKKRDRVFRVLSLFGESMETWLQDIKYSLRMLLKTPGVTMIAVLTLALGIGANTAIFSLLDQVILRRLPVEKPDELVVLRSPGPLRGHASSDGDITQSFSYKMYKSLRDKNEVFSGLLARYAIPLSTSSRGQTERAAGELVSGNYFEVLGVKPALGRLLTQSDDENHGAHPVAVLSHNYWTRRYAQDPSILNQTILVNGHTLTVVGVARAGFKGVQVGQLPDIFIPVTMKSQMTPNWDGLDDWNDYWLALIGRIKPGINAKQAEAGIVPTYRAALEEQLPTVQGWPQEVRERFLAKRILLIPGAGGRTITQNEIQTPLYVMFGMVFLVLLIACTNVANLLLVRGLGRQRELAVRLSLGASRWRLIRQLLVESLLMAILGGMVGVLVAFWVSDALFKAIENGGGINGLSSKLDGRILLFTFVLTLFTGLIFGLFPAWRVTRGDMTPALKDQSGNASASHTHARLRKTLVAAQVALTMLLLVGAGLLTRTLWNLRNVNLGMNTSRLISFSLAPELNGYTPVRTAVLGEQLIDAVGSIPGVQGVSVAEVSVLTDNTEGSNITVEGMERRDADDSHVNKNCIGPNYFSVMGIPLLSGREFSKKDTATSQKVAIINETMAKRFIQNRNPVGARFAFGSGNNVVPDIEIIGVVKDAKYANVREEAVPFVYLPYTQNKKLGDLNLYVKTQQEPSSVSATLRKEVQKLDANLPLFDMRTLDSVIDENLFGERMMAILSGCFGALAALLAGVGLYGVLAHWVVQRTHEIGIRVALGAEPGNIRWLVLSQGVRLTLIGVVIGLLCGLAAARVLGSVLFGVNAMDPLTFSIAGVLLALVALLACYLPARRATKVDPMIALRYE